MAYQSGYEACWASDVAISVSKHSFECRRPVYSCSPGRRTPSTSSLPKGDEKAVSSEAPAMPVASNSSANGSVKGTANGSANGHVTQYRTESSSEQNFEVNGTLSRQSSQYSVGWKNVRNGVICELGIENRFFERMNIESFLEYITHERLTNMPHRGSRWDKVLKSAEYFGLQISAFGETVEKFVHEGKQASDDTLGYCRLLLEVRPPLHYAQVQVLTI